MKFFIFDLFQNLLQLEQTSYKKSYILFICNQYQLHTCNYVSFYNGWLVRQSIYYQLTFLQFCFLPCRAAHKNFLVMWKDLIFVTCFSIKGYVCLSVCPSIGLCVCNHLRNAKSNAINSKVKNINKIRRICVFFQQ